MEFTEIDVFIIKIIFYSFIVDILLTLNTAILQKGDLLKIRSKIMMNYLKKSLIPDLLAMY